MNKATAATMNKDSESQQKDLSLFVKIVLTS